MHCPFFIPQRKAACHGFVFERKPFILVVSARILAPGAFSHDLQHPTAIDLQWLALARMRILAENLETPAFPYSKSKDSALILTRGALSASFGLELALIHDKSQYSIVSVYNDKNALRVTISDLLRPPWSNHEPRVSQHRRRGPPVQQVLDTEEFLGRYPRAIIVVLGLHAGHARAPTLRWGKRAGDLSPRVQGVLVRLATAHDDHH